MEKVTMYFRVDGITEDELLERLLKCVKLVAKGQTGYVERMMRYGRYGTCIECPRDGEGGIHPERCVNTERYDHQINATPGSHQPPPSG